MSESGSWQSRFGRTLLDWAFAIFLTLIGFWLIAWWRTPDMPTNAPSWTLQTVEGEEVSLSDFEGQTVILNFWATWCGPCRMEIPEFREFVTKYPDIPLLGIAVDGTAAQLKQFGRQNKMNYPILIADADIQRQYNVSTLPMTVIVGPDGEIMDTHVGVMLLQQLEWVTR